MLRKHVVAAALAASALALPGATVEAHRESSAGVVIEWNQLLQAQIPATAGLMSLRYYAMLHIAMFDAINSIEEEYTPYVVRIKHARGASAEAAAAQAARDVLTALIPAGQPAFDAALQARLARISRGKAQEGVRLGQKVAAKVLEWRQNDGWAVTPPVYEPPAIAGLWQRTPPGAAAAATQFPTVVPFAVLTPTLFLPPPPPPLNSAKYAADFNEVKLVGSLTSPVRTTEQTLRSRLFAGVVSRTSIWAMWNNVARDAALAKGLSLLDTARLFALVNVSMNDGLQTAHTSKFVYGLWRPYTAIRRADEDMNDATDADTSWTPLLTTPPYPSYAGNMSAVGMSAATALGLALGTDEVPFTVLWLGTLATPTTPAQPDVSRNFGGFLELAEAQAMSRLHGGIHFDFDNRAGQQVARSVAGYVFHNFMLPSKDR